MDLFAPFSAATLVLLAFRITGLVLIAPLFSARTVPMMMRTSLVVLFTWLMHPVALAQASAPALTPAQVLTEVLVGFAIGLGAALLVGAAEVAGDLLSVHTGLSGAAALDPLTSHSVPVLGQFVNLFVLTLLLTANAHLGMLEALAATLRLAPVGTALDVQAGMGAMVSLGTSLFALGVRFAAPVIGAVMLANVSLAVLNRAAPQVQILSVAFPLQIGVGLLALGTALPLMATFFTGWTQPYGEMLDRVLEALNARGGR